MVMLVLDEEKDEQEDDNGPRSREEDEQERDSLRCSVNNISYFLFFK